MEIWKAKASTNLITVIPMKANSSMENSLEWAKWLILMVVFIMDLGLMEKHMDKEKWFILMEIYMKVVIQMV